MPNRSVQVRPQALHDLEDICKYSLQQWGIARAEAYLLEINRAFGALANHHQLGRDYGRVNANLHAYNARPMSSFTLPLLPAFLLFGFFINQWTMCDTSPESH